MRVGVTMRVVNAPSYHDPRDAVSHDLLHWVTGQGHHAVLVPNVGDAEAFAVAERLEAVVFSGGNSLKPVPGGEDDTSPERDATERALIRYATARRIPSLGICRGLHVINDYFGGTLDPRLSHAPVRHVAFNHRVSLLPPFDKAISAREIETNSFHNQGIAPAGVASALHVLAVSSGDGLIEGIYHPSVPVLAVQWHPERPNPGRAFDAAVLRRFLSEGAFWAQ